MPTAAPASSTSRSSRLVHTNGAAILHYAHNVTGNSQAGQTLSPVYPLPFFATRSAGLSPYVLSQTVPTRGVLKHCRCGGMLPGSSSRSALKGLPLPCASPNSATKLSAKVPENDGAYWLGLGRSAESSACETPATACRPSVCTVRGGTGPLLRPQSVSALSYSLATLLSLNACPLNNRARSCTTWHC